MISMGSGSRRPRSAMRKALKKPANSAACKTNQWNQNARSGRTYENQDRVHLFKPVSFAFAVDDLHSWVSRIKQWVAV